MKRVDATLHLRLVRILEKAMRTLALTFLVGSCSTTTSSDKNEKDGLWCVGACIHVIHDKDKTESEKEIEEVVE